MNAPKEIVRVYRANNLKPMFYIEVCEVRHVSYYAIPISRQFEINTSIAYNVT